MKGGERNEHKSRATLFSIFSKFKLNKEAEMIVKNQFNCVFMTRKGNCKKGKQGKHYHCKGKHYHCNLKDLLTQNGEAKPTKVLIAFLECYQLNLKKNQEVGELFFRTVSKQITGQDLKPLDICNASVLSEILKGENTKNAYMFRIPDTWEIIFKSFGLNELST